MTQDLDIVVDHAAVSSQVEGFLSSAARLGFLLDSQTLREALSRKEQFQLYDQVECLKIDVYPREMIAGELGRSTEEEIFAGKHYPLASREDTILSKLVWIDKGSGKSRRDLRVLYRNTDDAQQRFIDDVAQQFGLTDLLAEVLAEPDEIR